MKNIKDLNVESRMIDTLDTALRQAYYTAMKNMIDKGYNPRQILATDYTKIDLNIDKIA